MENLRGGSPLSQISIPSTTVFVPPFPSIKVPLPSNGLNANRVPQEAMSTAHNNTTIALRCIAISFFRGSRSSLAKRYHSCCNIAQQNVAPPSETGEFPASAPQHFGLLHLAAPEVPEDFARCVVPR